jgi:FixJ family two-component response regulator
MNSTTSIVHVVDDDESYRTAIQRLLKAAGYQTRAYASAGEFLMTQRESARGCVVLDVHMPGPNGLELQEALSIRGEKLPIVFISGYATIPVSVCAMKAGAVDFLTKPVERELLLGAIEAAMTRAEEIRSTEETSRKYHGLTQRQREVLAGVVEGKMNKTIAAELGIAERTVKAHRAHLMQKLNARSLPELVQISGHLQNSVVPSNKFGRPHLVRNPAQSVSGLRHPQGESEIPFHSRT